MLFKDAAEAKERIAELEAEIERLSEGWIGCNDRLPEHGYHVIVSYYDLLTSEEPIIVLAMRQNNCWQLWDETYDLYDRFRDNGYIDHWMPLPSPPQEKA